VPAGGEFSACGYVWLCRVRQLSLSRLNHGLPRGEDEPGMMQGPAEVPHQSADAPLPAAAAVLDAATALDTALDMVEPQPTLVERLGGQFLLAWTSGHKSR
jgi:hypothetical protein